jgi:hypothetical protein
MNHLPSVFTTMELWKRLSPAVAGEIRKQIVGSNVWPYGDIPRAPFKTRDEALAFIQRQLDEVCLGGELRGSSQQVRRTGVTLSATRSSSPSTVPACPFQVSIATTQWGLAKRSWLLSL